MYRRLSSQTLLVLALMALVFAACSDTEEDPATDAGIHHDTGLDIHPDPPDSGIAEDVAEEPDTDPTPTPDTGAGADLDIDLNGVWAQQITVTAVANIPFVGEVETETISIQRLEIDQDGEDLTITAETCAIDLVSSNNTAETVIPDAFVEALEITTRPGEVSETGEVFVPRFLEIRGADLDDPENDALPDDPDDPRVLDPDNDGNPGLTVRVTGILDGEVYVVQRAWNELEGEMDGSDRFDGLVAWDNEQSVLGSDNQLLLQDTNDEPHPDQERSFFRTSRVDAAQSCADLVAGADALFDR